MSPAELHTALREVVAIGRRGGYDNDEIAEKLGRVVRDHAADEIERIADERTWVTMHDNEVVSAADLYEHIARLRGELEPVAYDFPPDDGGGSL